MADEWRPDFDAKVVSAAEAARSIESGDRIWVAGFSAAPTDVLIELCGRRDELLDVELFSGVLMHPFEFLKPEFRGHIDNHSFFLGPLEKHARALGGNTTVSSYHLSESRQAIENVHRPNVLALTVSEPSADGYMSMGPCGGVGCFAALQLAEKVIVSVNAQVPFVRGERNRIHVSQATHITLTEADVPCPPSPVPTELERKIAEQMLPHVGDGDTVQIGIGGIPNALAYSLESKSDLGVHTEMLTDSLVHLAKKGVVNGSRKNHFPGKIVFSFAAGSRELLDFVDDNDDLVILPLDEIVDPTEASKNDDFVSINTCLMVDLTGQVASESVGAKQISGTGGQLDLVRAARLSKGGRSFIALKSSRETANERTSNIVLSLPLGTAVTTPRADVQYVVTEYGIANMRQQSLEDRARSLIRLAHPDFRAELLADARRVGLIRT